MTPPVLDPDEQQHAIATWRYLRLALLGLLAFLLIAVVHERLKAPRGCWEVQISAYYYTPARDALVTTLLGLGLCLLCLRGNTPWENLFLNFAGMLAFISAVVPTPEVCPNCSSAPYAPENLRANIGNHMFALLAVGLVALLMLARPAIKHCKGPRPAGVPCWDPPFISYVGAWVLWLTTALVLELARGWFDAWGHKTAATLMFGCVGAVVIVNAVDVWKPPWQSNFWKNPYLIIAIAMLVSSVGFGAAEGLGWQYGILALEFGLLILFGVFWVVQSKELWTKGLRKHA